MTRKPATTPIDRGGPLVTLAEYSVFDQRAAEGKAVAQAIDAGRPILSRTALALRQKRQRREQRHQQSLAKD